MIVFRDEFSEKRYGFSSGGVGNTEFHGLIRRRYLDSKMGPQNGSECILG
jgi:hypothetical protein